MKYVYDIWKIYLFIFLNVDRFMWVNVLSVNTYILINIYIHIPIYISELMICLLMFVNTKAWAKSVTGFSKKLVESVKNHVMIGCVSSSVLQAGRISTMHQQHMLVWSGQRQCSVGHSACGPSQFLLIVDYNIYLFSYWELTTYSYFSFLFSKRFHLCWGSLVTVCRSVSK